MMNSTINTQTHIHPHTQLSHSWLFGRIIVVSSILIRLTLFMNSVLKDIIFNVFVIDI